MSAAAVHPRPIAGYFAFAAGAVALLLVLVHFWTGPFAPQQRAGVSIGAIAADMRQAAVRKLTGKPQPASVVAAWDEDRILKLITSILAGFSFIAGAAGFVRRETWQPAGAGVALGASAIAFHLLTWGILMVAGCFVLVAIIKSIDLFGT